jgi:hypothetical protein
MMPIIKEKAKLYPKNWKAIRAEILSRANNCCECKGECGSKHAFGECLAPNHSLNRWLETDGVLYGYSASDGKKIVLTIAHLNHNPRDSRRRNLKAFCQRCHNRYDSTHRQKNASKTRDRKRGQGRLF